MHVSLITFLHNRRLYQIHALTFRFQVFLSLIEGQHLVHLSGLIDIFTNHQRTFIFHDFSYSFPTQIQKYFMSFRYLFQMLSNTVDFYFVWMIKLLSKMLKNKENLKICFIIIFWILVYTFPQKHCFPAKNSSFT